MYGFAYRTFTLFGCPFQSNSTTKHKQAKILYILAQTPHNLIVTTHTGLHNNDLGSSRFAHHYSGNHFVFFSWPYLDVSVRAVHSFILCVQIKVTWFFHAGFPHSDIFGSQLDWQLPEAFGSLPPPSSSPDTKASTKHPYLKLITNLFRAYSAVIT